MIRRHRLSPANDVLKEIQRLTRLVFSTNHVEYYGDIGGKLLTQSFRTIAQDSGGNQVYAQTSMNPRYGLDSWSHYSQHEAEEDMADNLMHGIRIYTQDEDIIDIPPFSSIEELHMKVSIQGGDGN